MARNFYRKHFPRDIRHDVTISGITIFDFAKKVIPSFIVAVLVFIVMLANVNRVPVDMRLVYIIKALIIASLIPSSVIAYYKFNVYHKINKLKSGKSGHISLYPMVSPEGMIFKDGQGYSMLLLVTPTPIYVLTQTAIDQRRIQYKNLLSFCAKHNVSISVHIIRRILPGSFFTDKLFNKISDIDNIYMQTFMAARVGYWSQKPCAVTMHYLKITAYPKLLSLAQVAQVAQVAQKSEEKVIEHLSAAVKTAIDFLSRANFNVEIIKDEGIIQAVASETNRFTIPSKEWLLSPLRKEPEKIVPLAGAPSIIGSLKTEGGKCKNIILVRSFVPGVGTTTVASNLAYMLSENNTVAVDTNVSCPVLAESLGVHRQTDTYYVHIANGIHPDQILLFGPKRLRVMPGPVGNDQKIWPIDIEKFLNNLSGYDYVVIDSEPGIYDQVTRILEKIATKIVLVTDSSSIAKYIFDSVYNEWRASVDADVLVVYNKKRPEDPESQFLSIPFSEQINIAFDRRVPVVSFSPIFRLEFTKLVKKLTNQTKGE